MPDSLRRYGWRSLPGSYVHGILQARILEWAVMLSFRGSSWPRDRTWISCIGRWVLYCWTTREAPKTLQHPKKTCTITFPIPPANLTAHCSHPALWSLPTLASSWSPNPLACSSCQKFALGIPLPEIPILPHPCVAYSFTSSRSWLKSTSSMMPSLDTWSQFHTHTHTHNEIGPHTH